jgi:hypothetical protein
MKTFTRQFTPSFGNAVTTINSGESTTFDLKCDGFKKNNNVIVTANVTVQYIIGDSVQMDIQRNGKSIIGGNQIMFDRNNTTGYQYPLGNITYTMSIIDTDFKHEKNNYEFIITAGDNSTTVLQVILSAKVMDSNLIGFQQNFPSLDQPPVDMLPFNQDYIITIPFPESKNDNVARLVNVSLNIKADTGSVVQAELLDPNGISLTGGLQNIISLNAGDPNILNYEVNINYNVVDDKSYGNAIKSKVYTLRLVNTSFIQTNDVELDFYSFYAYVVPNNRIQSVNNFPILNDPSAVDIAASGKYTHTFKSKLDGKLKNLQFLANFNTGTIGGNYTVLGNILKENKSVSNGLFPISVTGPASTLNTQITIFDENENNDPYTVEIYNMGPAIISIDFFNMIETGETGDIKTYVKSLIIPLIIPPGGGDPNLTFSSTPVTYKQYDCINSATHLPAWTIPYCSNDDNVQSFGGFDAILTITTNIPAVSSYFPLGQGVGVFVNVLYPGSGGGNISLGSIPVYYTKAKFSTGTFNSNGSGHGPIQLQLSNGNTPFSFLTDGSLSSISATLTINYHSPSYF